MKKNNKIFILAMVILFLILIYTLGFSSNVAYANKDFILSRDDYPISDFNDTMQSFNDLLFSITIILFLVLIAVYITQSHKRTKYLTSNVVSISVLSGGLILFSLINFIKLPGFIAKYSQLLIDHPEQFERSKRISSLMPNNNMYYFGIVLSIVSLLYAIFMILFLVKRMKNQKEYIARRNEVLANAA